MFASATAAALGVILVDRLSDGAASVLIGPLDDQTILCSSMLVAFTALVTALCSVSARGWMLPLRILGIIAATLSALAAGFATLVSVDVARTSILEDGCDTGYVVVERDLFRGSRGMVYRQDSPFVAAPVDSVHGDDAHQPFAAGDYDAQSSDGFLTVVYHVNQGAPAVTTVMLPFVTDREPACGLEKNGRFASPPPSEPAAAPLDSAAIDEEMRLLLKDSLDAAAGTPVDASGATLDAGSVPSTVEPCIDGAGVQQELVVEFRTDDNAESVARILRLWDGHGYDADRAMQEDIRFSVGDAVERMTIRDRSTIDGLIRMAMTSGCMPPP